MRVSVLSHNLSSNALGRAHVLAELLSQNFDVEVAGPCLGGNIWKPIADERSYTKLDITEDLPSFIIATREAMHQLNGDVVIAVKPRTTSFGLGLLKRYLDNVPLILDIDDWETGGVHESPSRLRKHLKNIPHMYYVNSLNNTYGMEKLSYLADARTASNTFLQNRFEGTVIPHARNIRKFDPSSFEKSKIRSDLGLPQEKTIAMFSGTPRPHKGVEYLITAINSLETSDVIAVIVGAHDSEYVSKLKALAEEKIKFFGQQPFNELPKWIAAADIHVIPQKQNAANRGQLPAKVFDAMAMAKPVIATNISDLPLVLSDCGIIVDTESPDQIAESVLYLHENPTIRKVLGTTARERCVEKYSYKALRPKLEKIVYSVR